MSEVFDEEIDRAVTYVQPPLNPDSDPGSRIVRVEVKDEDFTETEHGVILRSHSGGALLGMFIPHHMVMGIDYLRRFKPEEKGTGQYI